jgi:hypothetical protein
MSTPTVISVCAKCSDLFTANLCDAEGQVTGEYAGYVPNFFPGQHWGDYVMLDIELTTGRILNWKPPLLAEVEALFKEVHCE